MQRHCISDERLCLWHSSCDLSVKSYKLKVVWVLSWRPNIRSCRSCRSSDMNRSRHCTIHDRPRIPMKSITCERLSLAETPVFQSFHQSRKTRRNDQPLQRTCKMYIIFYLTILSSSKQSQKSIQLSKTKYARKNWRSSFCEEFRTQKVQLSIYSLCIQKSERKKHDIIANQIYSGEVNTEEISWKREEYLRFSLLIGDNHFFSLQSCFLWLHSCLFEISFEKWNRKTFRTSDVGR